MKMSGFVFMLFIAIMADTGAYAQSKIDTNSEELLQEFQQTTEKWMLAYNSEDAQNLVPLYAEDADYISSHVAGLEANGRSKLIENFQKGMSMGGHIDSIDILKIEVSCDMATLLCRYQANNNGEIAIGRNLLVMKKIDGVWLISLHMTFV